jgi:hypothetical protein
MRVWIVWVGKVKLMGEKRNEYCNSVRKPEGKRLQEDLGKGGRIILKRILKEEDGMIWTGMMWLSIRTSGGLL